MSVSRELLLERITTNYKLSRFKVCLNTLGFFKNYVIGPLVSLKGIHQIMESDY